MWVRQIADIPGQPNNNGYFLMTDNEKVQEYYDKGLVVPALGPEGPDFHSAAPEDVLAYWEQVDRSETEKNLDKLSIKLYRPKDKRHDWTPTKVERKELEKGGEK